MSDLAILRAEVGTLRAGLDAVLGALALQRALLEALVAAVNRNNSTEFAVVRAGLNYKFGSY